MKKFIKSVLIIVVFFSLGSLLGWWASDLYRFAEGVINDTKGLDKNYESRDSIIPLREPIQTKKFDCYNGTTLEINICSLEELEYRDGLETVAFELTKKQLIKEGLIDGNNEIESLLLTSERFFDSLSKSNRQIIEHLHKGGNAVPYYGNQVEINLIKQRTDWLNKFLE